MAGSELGPSFHYSRFGTLVSPVEDSFHQSPSATGTLSDAGWQQNFRSERSGLLLEGKQSSNQSRHHLFITAEAGRRRMSAEEGEEATELIPEGARGVLMQGGLSQRRLGLGRPGEERGQNLVWGFLLARVLAESASPGSMGWALENPPSPVLLH